MSERKQAGRDQSAESAKVRKIAKISENSSGSVEVHRTDYSYSLQVTSGAKKGVKSKMQK